MRLWEWSKELPQMFLQVPPSSPSSQGLLLSSLLSEKNQGSLCVYKLYNTEKKNDFYQIKHYKPQLFFDVCWFWSKGYGKIHI